MTETPNDSPGTSGVDDIRAELGNELMRAAGANQKPRRRRLGIWVAAAVMAAVPTSFAVAELLPDEATREATLIPAPAPLFAPGGEYGGCPKEVVETLRKLEQLSDYPETPGYPVEGCPTLEQLLENGPAASELERILLDDDRPRP